MRVSLRVAALVLLVTALVAGSLFLLAFDRDSNPAARVQAAQVEDRTASGVDDGLAPARTDRGSQFRRGDRDADPGPSVETVGFIAALLSIVGATVALLLRARQLRPSMGRPWRRHSPRAPPVAFAVSVLAH